MIRFDTNYTVEELKNIYGDKSYVNRLMKLKNNSLVILLNTKLISEFKDVTYLYFNKEYQQLNITLQPIPNSIKRTIQKVGKNMKYMRIPIPHQFRKLFKLDKYSFIDFIKNDDGVFRCYFREEPLIRDYGN